MMFRCGQKYFEKCPTGKMVSCHGGSHPEFSATSLTVMKQLEILLSLSAGTDGFKDTDQAKSSLLSRWNQTQVKTHSLKISLCLPASLVELLRCSLSVCRSVWLPPLFMSWPRQDDGFFFFSFFKEVCIFWKVVNPPSKVCLYPNISGFKYGRNTLNLQFG